MSHFNQDQLPTELIKAFQREEVVLCVGNDLTENAGFPWWVNFVQSFVQSSDVHWPTDLADLSFDHIMNVIGRYDNQSGRAALLGGLRDALDTVFGLPHVYELMGSLPVKTVFVTSYDDLFDQALRYSGRHYHTTCVEKGLSLHSEDRIHVIHLLGMLNPPNSIVITPQDFNTYPQDHPRFVEQCRTIFESKTILFLGDSLFLPVINQIWDQVGLIADDLRRKGYAVLFDTNPHQTEDLRQRHIQCIHLTPKEGHSRIDTLEIWLGALLETINPTGQQIPQEPPSQASENYSVRWLPNVFEKPPFEVVRAEDDQHLSLYFLETLDFEQIRAPSTGTMFVFAESGHGKTAMCRMIDEVCYNNLSGSAARPRVMTVPFDQFERLVGLTEDRQRLGVDVQLLLVGAIVSRLDKTVRDFRLELSTRSQESLDDLKKRYLPDYLATQSLTETLEAEKSAGVFRYLAQLAKEMRIDHTYILVDRLDEFRLDDQVVIDIIVELIEQPVLLDLFQFKFFLPGKYNELLSGRQELCKRLDQIRQLTLNWPPYDLEAMLKWRLEKTSGGRISSFNWLMEFPLFDVDKVIVKYAHNSPRDLVRLAGSIIDNHMRQQVNGQQGLIEIETFREAVRRFAEERAYRRYGEDLIKRIVTLKQHPSSLDDLHRAMGDLQTVQIAEGKGLICEDSKIHRESKRYIIPDPRVRLLCPVCREDETIFYLQSKGEGA